MKRKIFFLVFLVCALAGLYAESMYNGKPYILDVHEYGTDWFLIDTNDDGITDYALQIHENGKRHQEAADYNYDGKMDNFYIYQDGILMQEELDTNYDGEIDLWVYMHEGIYIKQYKQDKNFDGSIDVHIDFSES